MLYRPADRKLFTEQALDFIVIGETTKADIERELEEQARISIGSTANSRVTRQQYRDGDWWLYAQRRWDSGLLVRSGDRRHRFLVLRFDEQGVVSGYKVSTSVRAPGLGRCNQEAVCYGRFEYTLLATTEDDRAAKRFDIPIGRCGIYVYGDPGTFGASVSVNDRPMGPLVNREHFYYRDLEPGSHEITGALMISAEDISATTEFECASGETYFFELRELGGFVFDGPLRVDLQRRDEVTGRNEVGNRRLTFVLTQEESIF